MKFKVLFWNIWCDNQYNGPAGSCKLLEELTRIVKEYQPDTIGLNEALQATGESEPFVAEHLRRLGYTYSYYAVASPMNDDWQIGTLVCSKLKLINPEPIILGRDRLATLRGYPGHTVKSVATRVEVTRGKVVGFISTHPIVLSKYTLLDHFGHTRSLSAYIKTHGYDTNTVMGGDFNEPAHMPLSFKSGHNHLFRRYTGTVRQPTWHLNAHPNSPLRLNLDQLFVTKLGSLKLEKFEVITTDISDHRPLFAQFDII